MTLSAYIALARDLIILIALAALIWLLVSYGKDVIKVHDMTAVSKQIAQNATTEAQWRQKADNAQVQLTTELADLRSRIDAQHTPVIVHTGPAHTCPVPGPATTSASSPPAGGTADAGSGGDIDVRPSINAFELKYEKALADCRAALASWP